MPDDTEVSRYVKVTTTNDHTTLQQASEVQCDEKLMIYYKTCPELNTNNILGVIPSKILPSLTLTTEVPVYEFIMWKLSPDKG